MGGLMGWLMGCWLEAVRGRCGVARARDLLLPVSLLLPRWPKSGKCPLAIAWMAAVLAWSGPSYAAFYHCKDASGHSVFQDHACAASMQTLQAVQSPSPAKAVEPAPAKQAEPSSPAEAGTGRHFFWKASRAGAIIYLLGSIHLGTPSLYPMPGVVTSAFQASNALVVEADPTSSAGGMLAGLGATGMYDDGSRLQDHIEPRLWESFKTAMQSLGLGMDMVAIAKPWFAAQMLEMAAMQRAGFDPRYGIDMHFIQQAKDKLPILELESTGEQLAMLDGLPMDQQVVMLEQAVKQFSQANATINAMLASWKSGDAEGLEKLIVQDAESDPRAEPMLRRIFYDRNRSMADKLLGFAKPGQAYFVVVGAGHMVGQRGLVSLLRQQGFEVTQL